MREFFFCIKTFVLTIAIVMVMQVQVGDRTIENHALSWVQTSPIIAPLNQVARGGAQLISDVAKKVRGQITPGPSGRQRSSKD